MRAFVLLAVLLAAAVSGDAQTAYPTLDNFCAEMNCIAGPNNADMSFLWHLSPDPKKGITLPVNLQSLWSSKGLTIEFLAMWDAVGEFANQWVWIFHDGVNTSLAFTLDSTKAPNGEDAVVQLVMTVDGIVVDTVQMTMSRVGPSWIGPKGSWFHVAIVLSDLGDTLLKISMPPGSTLDDWHRENVSSTFSGGSTWLGGSAWAQTFLRLGTWADGVVDKPAGNGARSSHSFAGRIAEFRVWSRTFTSFEIENELAFRSLRGDDTSLEAYYRFDEVRSAAHVNSVNASADSNAIVDTGTGIYFQTVHTEAAAKDFRAPIINQWTRYVDATITEPAQVQKFFVSNILAEQSPLYQVVVRSLPANGALCVESSVTTGGRNCSLSVGQELSHPYVEFNPGATHPSGLPVEFSFVPDRRSCGNVERATFGIKYSADYSDPLYDLKIDFDVRLPSSAQIASAPTPVSTLGGLLVLSGSNFGLDGPLLPSESVSITGVFPASRPCSSGNVSASGASLTCAVPAGVGAGGTIVVSICGRQTLFPGMFNYSKPSISSVEGIGGRAVNITGLHFGDYTAWQQAGGNQITVGGFPCEVQSSTNFGPTSIVCSIIYNSTNVTEVVTGIQVVSVQIAGQSVSASFDIQICQPNCFNQGKCVGKDTCDCSGTGFRGNACTELNVCVPLCENGGVCEHSSTAGNASAGGTFCECSQANEVPPKCVVPATTESASTAAPTATESASTVEGFPVVYVVIAAVVFLCLLAAVVALIFWQRRTAAGTEKRHVVVPLHKKDFTKIIYGDQQIASVPQTDGDIVALEELLLEDDLKLARAVCELTQITEADSIAKALVIVFQANDKAITLLDRFVDDEVANTDSAGTLFRSNSMVSKMFKFYSRLIGLPFLYGAIAPEISSIIDDNLGLEVDPEKIDDHGDLDEMRWLLMGQCQKVLKQILRSGSSCPGQFSSLLANVKTKVEVQFPEAVNTTLGGFIFLRFFCPAISSPDAYGIIDQPPNEGARRLLILITKVLQNLSNDVEFGSKEPYMAKMNDFIQSNRDKLPQFYTDIIASTNSPAPIELPKTIKAYSLGVLSQHLHDNMDAIDDDELRQRLAGLC